MGRRMLKTLTLILILATSRQGFTQERAAVCTESTEVCLTRAVSKLEEQIVALQNSVADLRAQAELYRIQAEQLAQRVQQVGIQLPATQSAPDGRVESANATGVGDQAGAARSVQSNRLQEQLELLGGKIDDQYQTKVESGSKYRVRLSGLVMLNMATNRGVPDSIDTPSTASVGDFLNGTRSFTGTLRQSQIGIDVFGPEWANAKVSGDLRFDFAGGFPDTENGVSLGIARLRTGNVRFQWKHTSLTAGQDAPMLSPLSPTSFVALAQPDFSYSGNLWTWVPQIQLQHWVDLTPSQRLSFSVGILDPLTGESPGSQFDRTAQAGERSRQPGYSARIGWSNSQNEDHPTSINFSGYFSRQDWGFNRTVDGWATTADAEFPLSNRFSLRAEAYRGKALGGFGASGGQSVISSDALQNSRAIVTGLDTVGGWTEMSFAASPVLQFSSGYGVDNPFSSQLRRFLPVQNLLNPGLGINRAAMTNVIFRPRSDLLFSIEYRHLMASRLVDHRASVDNVEMGIGLLF